MIAESRSTTRVMPIGAGHPPACTTSGPSRSTAISSTTEITVVAVSIATPMIRCACATDRATIDRPAPSSGSTMGRATQVLHRPPPSSRATHRRRSRHRVVRSQDGVVVGGEAAASLVTASALVGDLLVAPATAGDGPVGDVVLDLVVVGQQPAAVRQRQQQRGDAERDDDRRQRHRLRQRVAEVGDVAGADQRRGAAARPTSSAARWRRGSAAPAR